MTYLVGVALLVAGLVFGIFAFAQIWYPIFHSLPRIIVLRFRNMLTKSIASLVCYTIVTPIIWGLLTWLTIWLAGRFLPTLSNLYYLCGLIAGAVGCLIFSSRTGLDDDFQSSYGRFIKKELALGQEAANRRSNDMNAMNEMDPVEAEKVVNGYGGAIAKGTDGNFVRREAWLPCSKARIKEAYFIYLSAIVDKHGYLPKDVGEPLVNTYSMLNTFIDDETANHILEIEGRMNRKELDDSKASDKSMIEEYFAYAQTMRDGELFDEINGFIGECLRKQKRPSQC